MDEIREKNEKNKTIKYMISFTLTIIVLIILIKTVFKVGKVDGRSMYPTLCDKELTFGISPTFRSVRRGDIVTLDAKSGIIKRVIALPGDTVKIEGKDVFVNGEKLDEPYINPEEEVLPWQLEVTVKDGQVFVMGDNRNHSLDSREDGCYNLSDIDSIVVFHAR